MLPFWMRFSSRSATPTVDPKSPKDLLSKMADPATLELRRQMEKELRLVKDKYEELEKENVRLMGENRRLKQSPSFDEFMPPSSLSRLESSPKVRRLEMENADLRDEIASLKVKIARATAADPTWDYRPGRLDHLSFSTKISSTLRGSEDDTQSLKFKIFDLEDKVSTLAEELEKRKQPEMDPEPLRKRIGELDVEISK